MSTQTAVPKDHPLMVAWEAHKASEEYANSLRWAQALKLEIGADNVARLQHPHIEGSLWALFVAGWQAKKAADTTTVG